MKALILNSGAGRRMGDLTSEHPKCMTTISQNETILSRQLQQIVDTGIEEVVITTGAFDNVLVNYCENLDLPIKLTYVKNPDFKNTNYIYSIYCARKYLDDDLILMHGDLVFENSVIDQIMAYERSCMVVSSTLPLPEKDFKAVIHDDHIFKIGIEYFSQAYAAQPLYKILKKDWKVWLNRIIEYCENGNVKCYAENAYNEISDSCILYPLDIKNQFCSEIDDQKDLMIVAQKLYEIENRKVYMSFSTDILHSGHLAIIKKAQRLGKVIIGVLSDEAVASYKHFPLLQYSERKAIFESITGVYSVVKQNTLSYRENIEKYHPDFVVHGDDWKTGIQKPIRDELVSILASYGGRLVEFPYSSGEKYAELDRRAQAELSMPDIRRARLKKILKMKGTISAMEAHSGLSGSSCGEYKSGGGWWGSPI